MNLKFRAWHKERHVMSGITFINFINKIVGLKSIIEMADGTPCIITEDISMNMIVLMQSTGLHDKEGNEIFEDDILAYDFGGGVETYIIERDLDDNQLHALYLHCVGYNTDSLGNGPTCSSIIVGNRWQNPELMEMEDEK